MQRQIKACTHCRQHKVRCDAAVCFPKPCSRCVKFDLQCNVDQHFKPRKGGQVELLREHLAKMQEQLDHINNPSRSSKSPGPAEEDATPRKKFKAELPGVEKAHEQVEDEQEEVQQIKANVAARMAAGGRLEPAQGPFHLESVTIDSKKAAELHTRFMKDYWPFIPIFESNSAGELYARSDVLFWAVMTTAALSEPTSEFYCACVGPLKRLVASKCLLETTRSSSVVQALLVLCSWQLPAEKMLEDVSPRYLSLAQSMALQLGMHRGKFIYEFSRNQQLMPNAVKWRSRTWIQLFITHQLISASSGLPPSMPVDYIIDHVARNELVHQLPARTIATVKLMVFYSKIVAIMSSNLKSEDGLADPNARCPLISILRADLDALFKPDPDFDDPVVHIGYLYLRCTLDSFSFLPETPMTQQSEFIADAHQTSTRIVTLVRQLVGARRITEYPALIRQASSFSALVLFRLQLLPQLPETYITSARESVVTIHRLYRNISPSWLEPHVTNDISRIAKILESLNHVVITHPEMLSSRRIMKYMRSHLTFSLFYELVYIIHDARRRNTRKANNREDSELSATYTPSIPGTSPNRDESQDPSPDASASHESISPLNSGMHTMIQGHENARQRGMHPLPLFNKISSDSYLSNTVVSPNGTTLTTLVPADATEPQRTANNASTISDSLKVPNSAVRQRYHTDMLPKTGETNISAAYSAFEQAGHQPAEYLGFGSANGSSLNGLAAAIPEEMPDSNISHMLEGLDWMNTEGDDFLGWMPPRPE